MRPAVLSVVKLLFLALANLPFIRAAPLRSPLVSVLEEVTPKVPKDPQLWIYLGVAMALVLGGGAFAGLTIALMGQDEIYLQVIATSGEGAERRHAKKVLRLLKKGKHWVLVTLLLSNVITNETLPIVLDRSLGGGWPAVLSSTVLIVIFGEIAPQSVCVRYGLPIGAFMSPFVLALMWIMAPVAWPTAKFLDWVLGEDHGTTYKKAGLKTLVTLHKTLGTTPDERLNQDEVTIISAVLDLKDKTVGSIMTPMGDVFTMSSDTVLDEPMMDKILSQGYSRIPIHSPDNPRNFVGMLLVKILITYDPEDAMRVRDFALATLPETRPETSCLDIVNFFQEGKSHMVLVSDFPGEDHGALGVLTLEDVIEELIGEEIIDESDVFVDVHKAIRRAVPAPRMRVPKGAVVEEPESSQGVATERELEAEVVEANNEANANGTGDTGKPSTAEPNAASLLLRRKSSSGGSGNLKMVQSNINSPEMRQHLKHLGPSNVASRPKQTRYNTVKIKPGVGTIREDMATSASQTTSGTPGSESISAPTAAQSNAGQSLLNPAGRETSDGGRSPGYGTMSTSPTSTRVRSLSRQDPTPTPAGNGTTEDPTPEPVTEVHHQHEQPPMQRSEDAEGMPRPEKLIVGPSGASQRPPSIRSLSSHSTVASLEPHSPRKRRTGARSGSITENLIDHGGVRKMVLETTSSSDTEGVGVNGKTGAKTEERDGEGDENVEPETEKGGAEKRKKKKRAGKKFRQGGKKGSSSGSGSGESTPLLSKNE
ncbi:hypothetical protein B0A49_01385 [Cryomyces minteri]|uniref:CNNM transmembrane domain-containing protein n=1 Tax=Cryomyces minteri TaxID=331657 RepID=A0A4U0XTZ3_9PEZI|nr:hypothetical protein B0A49_01385 [Cryomyces minteri]